MHGYYLKFSLPVLHSLNQWPSKDGLTLAVSAPSGISFEIKILAPIPSLRVLGSAVCDFTSTKMILRRTQV